MVIRDLGPVLEPCRKRIDDGEGWDGGDTGLVRRRVGDLVQLRKSLRDVCTIVELEQVAAGYGAPLTVPDRYGRDDGRLEVPLVRLRTGDLEWRAGRVRFGDVLVAVAVKVGIQTAIVVDLQGEFATRRAGGVQLVGLRLVVFIGNGVVDGEGVGGGRPANSNADHTPGLERRAVLTPVGVLVEENHAEQGEPGARVGGGSVNELERAGELSIDLGRNLVRHATHVLDGVEPEIAWHLGLGEVGARHRKDGLPDALGQAVGGLPPGRGATDLEMVAVDPATGAAA